DARLGTDIQQAPPNGVLANGARVRAGGDAGVDAGPRAAVVCRLPQVGTEIVELVAVRGDICRPRIVVRRLDDRDAGEVRHVARRDVRPCPAVVPGDMYETVVGASPED